MTNIYSRNDTPNFVEFWALCILEEIIFKAKDETKPSNENFQDFATRLKKKIGKFGIFEPRLKYNNQPHGIQDMSKVQFFECNEYGYFKIEFPKDPQNKKNNKRKEKVDFTLLKKMKNLKRS